MDQERSEVREVEDARRRVADDVRSIAHDANVVDRAKENMQCRVGDLRDRVSDVRDQLQDRMQDMSRGMRLRSANPIGMLLAGMAVGFLAGLLLPVRRSEDARLGPVAEEMKERARQARSEAIRRGEVIKETIDVATSDSEI